MLQVWGAIAIFIFCPLLGGLPLIGWFTYALTGRQLAVVGTGNISVSAAFYHGGKTAGILAVLSEAFKGIAAVLLARAFFPTQPAWELIALIALVIGRYWIGKGAGTTNVVWGVVVHDWRVALLVFLIGGISFTILRERQWGRTWVLILFPSITALLHAEDPARSGAAIVLALLLGWIYQQIPDDLDLATQSGKAESQQVFRFFRGDRAIRSLNEPLDASKVGQKAATLSQLKRWGYAVPLGWVLPPGDDPEPLIEFLQPSEQAPLVVRSSAIGEDAEQASAAGQYVTILHVTSREALQQAITKVLASYDRAGAVQYRRRSGLPEDAMAVLIQKQVRGVFSGVAFSRDPINQDDAVVIEALPGDASRVVSGQVTPEQYRISLLETLVEAGDVPPALIQHVAVLARRLENKYLGVPQDIEWSYDGQVLWLLQSRPITTLLPIWTRKIAAEVIPGLVHPLTWSINRPVTCGVWGDIFTTVLGRRARGLDFNQTATLHYSRAYFNASLLGQIFRRMGLPPESLEFLTRGAKFSKPSLRSTLQSIPGLVRLLARELALEHDFGRDDRQRFAPVLALLAQRSIDALSPTELLERVELILQLLRRATYYSIMAPLSAALRQSVLRVEDTQLDNSKTPEVACLQAIASLATEARRLLGGTAAFEQLAVIPEGRSILERFERLLDVYGYLSEVGTNIAVPTWKEDPLPVRELFVRFLENEPPRQRERRAKRGAGWLVQGRVDLKGRVTVVYSQLLAQLRWCFVALEKVWLQSGLLSEEGDIFFLELDEVERVVAGCDSALLAQLGQLVQKRRSQLQQDRAIDLVPPLVYGSVADRPIMPLPDQSITPSQLLQGIGASPGRIEGQVKVLRSFQGLPEIDQNTILVVPYTDSGWAPLLARAGGVVAEVGGRLSHGAIVAREYGIPAVMDIHNATQLLRDGQRVRIDGQLGVVEIL